MATFQRVAFWAAVALSVLFTLFGLLHVIGLESAPSFEVANTKIQSHVLAGIGFAILAVALRPAPTPLK